MAFSISLKAQTLQPLWLHLYFFRSSQLSRSRQAWKHEPEGRHGKILSFSFNPTVIWERQLEISKRSCWTWQEVKVSEDIHDRKHQGRHCLAQTLSHTVWRTWVLCTQLKLCCLTSCWHEIKHKKIKEEDNVALREVTNPKALKLHYTKHCIHTDNHRSLAIIRITLVDSSLRTLHRMSPETFTRFPSKERCFPFCPQKFSYRAKSFYFKPQKPKTNLI